MPPRSLRTKSHDDKTMERIGEMRGKGMSNADMRANLKMQKGDEVDTAAGPVSAKKAWPKVADKVKANREAVQKGGEGAPPVDLYRLLDGIVPGLSSLLDSDPSGWTQNQCCHANKVVVILLRAEPDMMIEMEAVEDEEPETKTGATEVTPDEDAEDEPTP